MVLRVVQNCFSPRQLGCFVARLSAQGQERLGHVQGHRVAPLDASSGPGHRRPWLNNGMPLPVDT